MTEDENVNQDAPQEQTEETTETETPKEAN